MADVLNIKVDIDGPMRACKILREDQIPFTIARALTMTANDARWALRSLEGKVFTLRNDWTQARTLVQMATKTDLTAQVYTDTENRKTSAPDYLPGQEEGRIKRPYGTVVVEGAAYIGVPTNYLRKLTGPGPIPTWARPQNLLAGTQTAGRRGNKRGMEGPTARGFVTQGHEFFPQRLHTGKLAVMARRIGTRDAFPVWLLIRSATVRPIFPALQSVEDTAQRTFPANFEKAATEVAVNEHLRGTGVSVKL